MFYALAFETSSENQSSEIRPHEERMEAKTKVAKLEGSLRDK